MLTITIFALMNPNVQNEDYLLTESFLSKIDCQNIMDLNKKIIEWNQKMYPSPTFVGHNELLKHYGKSLNWRKIKKWYDERLVRTTMKKMVDKARVEYDPKNPAHKDRPVVDTIFYALEDFAILIEKDEMVKNSKVQLVLGTFQTTKGKKGLLRDFTKDSPDLNEIDNLSDSFGTFIAWLAKEKIKEETSSLTPEEKAKFLKILDDVIPENK
jgi:hypothetical protein